MTRKTWKPKKHILRINSMGFQVFWFFYSIRNPKTQYSQSALPWPLWKDSKNGTRVLPQPLRKDSRNGRRVLSQPQWKDGPIDPKKATEFDPTRQIQSKDRFQFKWDTKTKDIVTTHISRSIRSTINEKRTIDGLDTLPFGWVSKTGCSIN